MCYDYSMDITKHIPEEFDLQNFAEIFIGVSSRLNKVWYNPDRNLLLVLFHPSKKQLGEGSVGSFYLYENVTEEFINGIYNAIDNGVSVGVLFNEIIKNVEQYPYTLLAS